MRQVRLGAVFVWAFALVLVSAPVRAQETKAAASNPDIEEKAMAVLKRSAEFLSQAQRFSVTNVGKTIITWSDIVVKN